MQGLRGENGCILCHARLSGSKQPYFQLSLLKGCASDSGLELISLERAIIMNNQFFNIGFAVSIFTAGCIASLPATAATIVPPGSEVADKTIGEWTAEWWKWALSQSVPEDAFTDMTGENANVNQSGPIFFVAGTTGGMATRSFTVPSNKFLLFPLVNFIGVEEEGFSGQELIDTVTAAVDSVDSLEASIDGVPIENPFDFRETTPGFFDIEAVEGNPFFGLQEELRGFGDGYYVIVEPLAPGTTSTFIFGGGSTAFEFTTQVTSTITAVPEPVSTLTLLGTGLGLVIWPGIGQLKKKRQA